MNITSEMIRKYQNDNKIHTFVNTFVSFMITHGYNDKDMDDIFGMCRYRYNEEINHIVDGANELRKSSDQ